ncbi:hypothetical protein BD311DRAFT_750666 [Dichomitus squalens]|uniref:Uncharacterized protein n=1 Tax=Dichomitus squalens TaxID=114155 RepID=A0A4Q9N0S4_9APHY|nr:hypothetical protein BD311DRAFT_750666 [Dichomitus squalens]
MGRRCSPTDMIPAAQCQRPTEICHIGHSTSAACSHFALLRFGVRSQASWDHGDESCADLIQAIC